MLWRVVSIDTTGIPRELFSDSDKFECAAHAENYWNEQAADGEQVLVVNTNHPLSKAIELRKQKAFVCN